MMNRLAIATVILIVAAQWVVATQFITAATDAMIKCSIQTSQESISK